MGISLCVTCFIVNLCTFDDVGVYKGEGFNRTSGMGLGLRDQSGVFCAFGRCLNRVSLKMWWDSQYSW